jgi:hypothetical protein
MKARQPKEAEKNRAATGTPDLLVLAKKAGA